MKQGRRRVGRSKKAGGAVNAVRLLLPALLSIWSQQPRAHHQCRPRLSGPGAATSAAITPWTPGRKVPGATSAVRASRL